VCGLGLPEGGEDEIEGREGSGAVSVSGGSETTERSITARSLFFGLLAIVVLSILPEFVVVRVAGEHPCLGFV